MTWAATSNITACHIHQADQALCLVVAGGVIQADVVEGPFGPAQVDGVEDGWRIASEDSRSTKNKKHNDTVPFVKIALGGWSRSSKSMQKPQFDDL